jgi:hypothetical protein
LYVRGGKGVKEKVRRRSWFIQLEGRVALYYRLKHEIILSRPRAKAEKFAGSRNPFKLAPATGRAADYFVDLPPHGSYPH